MNRIQKKGFPVVGIIFLVLGLYKFLQGGHWVVWIILGVLLGGLSVFRRNTGAPR